MCLCERNRVKLSSGLGKTEQGTSSTSLGKRAFSLLCPQICHLCLGAWLWGRSRELSLCGDATSSSPLPAQSLAAGMGLPVSSLSKSKISSNQHLPPHGCVRKTSQACVPYSSHGSYHLCWLMQCNQQFNMLLLNTLIILFLSDTAITRFLCFDAKSSKILNWSN